MASGALNVDIGPEDNVRLGEDRTVRVRVVQADGVTPQTMTGWSLRFQVRPSPDGAAVVTKATGGSGIVIENGAGANDQAAVTLSAADTALLSEGWHVYGLMRTDAGSKSVLVEGRLLARRAPVTAT